MAIPAETRVIAETALGEFCDKHSAGADSLRYVYRFETNAALLIEQRPGFLNSAEWSSKQIAKLRYSEARNLWSLYWCDANGKWHRVSNVESEKDIRKLLQAVVDDPVGVFWS